jgi:hypothetical protein
VISQATQKILSHNQIGTPCKRGKSVGPLAAVLHHPCKVAAYYCQSTIVTSVKKMTDKKKFAAIEEVIYGDVGKNIIGAC